MSRQMDPIIMPTQTFRFRLPDLALYEQQKAVSSSASCALVLANQPTSAHEVFAKRIDCALRGIGSEAPNIFPGNLVPAPGGSGRFVDRGILFYDQYNFYEQLGWFRDEIIQISNPGERIDQTVSLLRRIRLKWDCVQAEYSRKSIDFAREFGERAQSSRNHGVAERALFEVEAAASYLTATENLTPILQTQFGANWIGVYSMRLASIRQTELCSTERIFDELFNLTRSSFAPIIVNEYNTVADGNHRLTSAWIWNVLRACRDEKWDLNIPEFQSAIRSAMLQFDLFRSPITAREVLHHLGVLLSRAAIGSELEARLKPTMQTSVEIHDVPVIVLPEYLSCAANKELYDSGADVVRAHPALYRAISQAPNLVLPARASYHYTDCVPLPWFDIIH